MTSCCLLVELSLNSFGIRIHDWAYNALVNVTYTSVLIIFMLSKAINEWPYDFLAVDTPLCFGWYLGMVITSIVFYTLAWKLGDLKYKYWANGLGGSTDSNVVFNMGQNGNKLQKPLLFS